jgi:hypothetical protein
MLKRIGIGFVALAAIAVAGVALQPSHFSVSRSAVVPAPPGEVFAVLDGFEHFPDWSPWDKRDPAMSRERSGPASGAGATYHWVGNDDVGEGRMTIGESVPGEKVAIRLEFIKPFAAVNEDVFTLQPEGTATRVTWTMSGELGFVGKAFVLLQSHDQMIGPDFERGLEALGPVVEHAAVEARASMLQALGTQEVCHPDLRCTVQEMICAQPLLAR